MTLAGTLGFLFDVIVVARYLIAQLHDVSVSDGAARLEEGIHMPVALHHVVNEEPVASRQHSVDIVEHESC